MIRKVGGPGAQYSGPIDDSPATVLAKKTGEVIKNHRGDNPTGKDLSGLVDPKFHDPSRINARVMHFDDEQSSQ